MDNTVNTTSETMDAFEDEINKSFKKIEEGDILTGSVIGVSDTNINLDLGSYAEGIINADELSNDPSFSIKSDIAVGEKVTAVVIKTDDGEGNILLSKKRADSILAWEKLKEHMENKTIFHLKVASTVNGGLITYLEGIRAFIPASQITVSYVENLEEWVGKSIDAIVITVDEEKSRLVLSGKLVAQEKALEDKNEKISNLQLGVVTSGTVEKITTYGAFVNIGNGISGLVHISQICGRRIKSPNEVLKEGQEVKVKIIDKKEGKIGLSIKAVEDNDNDFDSVDVVPAEYSSNASASTNLGSLLSNLKL